MHPALLVGIGPDASENHGFWSWESIGTAGAGVVFSPRQARRVEMPTTAAAMKRRAPPTRCPRGARAASASGSSFSGVEAGPGALLMVENPYRRKRIRERGSVERTARRHEFARGPLRLGRGASSPRPAGSAVVGRASLPVGSEDRWISWRALIGKRDRQGDQGASASDPKGGREAPGERKSLGVCHRRPAGGREAKTNVPAFVVGRVDPQGDTRPPGSDRNPPTKAKKRAHPFDLRGKGAMGFRWYRARNIKSNLQDQKSGIILDDMNPARSMLLSEFVSNHPSIYETENPPHPQVNNSR
jgi:hypothetical protein